MSLTRSTIFLPLAFLFACTIRDPKPPAPPPADPYAPALALIEEGKTLLRDGDLVLRSGQEFSSQFIRNFNRKDKSYSHAGVVFFENGYPFIFHIVPGDDRQTEKMRKDSLVRFAHPRKNFGFGIYRYNLNSDELHGFKQQVYAYLQQEVRFDSAFNLKTDDRMYCSEMISKALDHATQGDIRIELTKPNPSEVRFFAKHLHLDTRYVQELKLVAIENLFLHPQCRMVKRFDFTSRP